MGEIPIPTPPFCCELKSAIKKEAKRKKKRAKRQFKFQVENCEVSVCPDLCVSQCVAVLG